MKESTDFNYIKSLYEKNINNESELVNAILEIEDYSTLYDNETGNSIIHWAIMNLKESNCIRLLEHYSGNLNVYNNEGLTPFFYASKRQYYRLIYLMIKCLQTKNEEEEVCKEEEIEIKRYNYNEFATTKIIGHGTGGNVYAAIHKPTGKYYVLKNVKRSGEKSHDIGMIKEFLFNKKINNIYSNHDVIPKFYGFCLNESSEVEYEMCENSTASNAEKVLQKKGKLYLIFEPLLTTISNYIRGIPQEKLYDELKELLDDSLDLIEKIHKVGILHSDVKNTNIMFDSRGKLRVIDFGIADFYGIAPTNRVTRYYISTYTTFDNFSRQRYVIDNNKNVVGSFYCDRPSYYSDLYSIGITFIHINFPKYFPMFFYQDQKLFEVRLTKTPHNDKGYTDFTYYMNITDVVPIDKIKLPEEYLKRLKRLLKLKGSDRLLNKEKAKSKKIYSKDYLNRNVNGNDEGYELIFYDEICKAYINDKLILDLNSETENIVDTISCLNKKYADYFNNYSFDTIVNSIYYYRILNFNEVSDLVNLIQYFMCVFESHSRNEIPVNSKTILMLEKCQYFPVLVHLKSIIYEDESNIGKDANELGRIELETANLFLDYVTLYREKNDLTIRELMEVSYNIICNNDTKGDSKVRDWLVEDIIGQEKRVWSSTTTK